MTIPRLLIWNKFTKDFLKTPKLKILPDRLESMRSDFGFTLGVSAPFLIIPMIPFMLTVVISKEIPQVLFLLMSIPFSLTWFIMLNKDFRDGQSVAKIIHGFQIVDSGNEQPASDFKCMLRNTTAIIWPVEVLVSLINPTRRIGDIIAGTKLIKVPKQNIDEHIDKFRNIDSIQTKTTYVGLTISLCMSVVIFFIQYINMGSY